MKKLSINRNNYQEFFLLYVDNELNSVEKELVQDFILQNPDLEGELLMLQQSTFKADQAIVFEDKASLLRFDNIVGTIHADNWEEYAISYSDDELTSAERTELEDFISTHPQYRQEFTLLQSLKFTADESVTFRDKNSLYRHEKAARPLVIPWWRLSAAAAVVLIAGLLWLYNSTAPGPAGETVGVTSRGSLNQMTKPAVDTPARPEIARALPPVTAPASSSAISNDDVVVSNKVKKKRPVIAIDQTAKKRREVPAGIAKNSAASDRSIQSPVASQVRSKVKTEQEKSAIPVEAIEPPEKRMAVITDQPVVLSKTADNHHDSFAEADNAHASDNVYLASMPVDRKNSFRGILRKASRLLDKTTSFKGSKKSSLLIGNLEIAFQ